MNIVNEYNIPQYNEYIHLTSYFKRLLYVIDYSIV